MQEFKQEKLKLKPAGGALNVLKKALITSSLNRRIRNSQFSAREIITTRDQNTGEKIEIDDEKLALSQLERRITNHPISAKSKVPNGIMAMRATVRPGALVFIKKDKSKDRGRERYLVVKMDNGGDKCWIKKLES